MVEKKTFFKRKKTCPFQGENAPVIDWKNPNLLKRFISERGKIMPSRITYVSQKSQRKLATAIKRARYMALMPYVETDTSRSGHTGHSSSGGGRR